MTNRNSTNHINPTCYLLDMDNTIFSLISVYITDVKHDEMQLRLSVSISFVDPSRQQNVPLCFGWYWVFTVWILVAQFFFSLRQLFPVF